MVHWIVSKIVLRHLWTSLEITVTVTKEKKTFQRKQKEQEEIKMDLLIYKSV
jgi:hypothetical protein